MSDNLLQRSVTTSVREPGHHDEDIAEDDVDHAALAVEPACRGCRSTAARTASTARRWSCPRPSGSASMSRPAAPRFRRKRCGACRLFSQAAGRHHRPHGQPLQDGRGLAGQQADRRRRGPQQVLHHRPGAGRGPEQGRPRQRPADRPADRRRVLRRDRSGLRQALGRDRPHDHALHPADPLAQGPRRRAGGAART